MGLLTARYGIMSDIDPHVDTDVDTVGREGADRTLPSDLVPIPTQPWPERPAELPLVPQEVRTALWLTAGNITNAASVLKVTSMRLRTFVRNSPYLSAEVEEAKEQVVDKAESIVVDALDSNDPTRQDQMARYVLNSSHGRKRGWGQGSSNVQIDARGSKFTISWADGSRFDDKRDAEDAEVIDVTP